MSPEFVFNEISEEQYHTAGSKWVTFPLGEPLSKRVGETLALDIEIGMVDWDNPGQSMKIPIKVTEAGVDQGKEDKLSFGVKITKDGKSGIWKGKEAYEHVTGKEMSMIAGSDGKKHPGFTEQDVMEMMGKPAVGLWEVMKGTKGGVEGAEPTYYPKLVAILPAGQKPKSEALM